MIDTLGEKIRQLRLNGKIPLRTVSAFLDIDQAILSKVERGIRKASREQVVKLAEFFKVEEEELLLPWLSEKLLYEVKGEELALKALQVAESRVIYQSSSKVSNNVLISKIRESLDKDGRVSSAWLYGSVMSGQARPDSDVDLIIEFKEDKKYSMFDLLDIAHVIESKIDRKVDLVEKGQIKDFAMKTAAENLQKIYG